MVFDVYLCILSNKNVNAKNRSKLYYVHIPFFSKYTSFECTRIATGCTSNKVRTGKKNDVTIVV